MVFVVNWVVGEFKFAVLQLCVDFLFPQSRLKSSTTWSVSWKMNLYSRPKLSDLLPYCCINCLKNHSSVPFAMAHTYIAHNWNGSTPPFLGINTCQILPSVGLVSPTITLAGSIYSQLQKSIIWLLSGVSCALRRRTSIACSKKCRIIS